MLSDSSKIQLAGCDTGTEMPIYGCLCRKKYTPCVADKDLFGAAETDPAHTAQFQVGTRTGAAEHL